MILVPFPRILNHFWLRSFSQFWQKKVKGYISRTFFSLKILLASYIIKVSCYVSLVFDTLTPPTFGSTKETRRASLAVPTKPSKHSSTRRHSYVSASILRKRRARSAQDLNDDLSELNGINVADVDAELLQNSIKLSPMEDKHVKFSDE